MKPQTVYLVAFTDESTGFLGLGLQDMPRNEETNAATDGLLIAHDILEHQNGARNIGSIDDELEALGGLWYVRCQHGEIRRDGVGSMYNPHQSIAADITRMFRDFYYGAYLDTKPPRTRACEADDNFKDILNYAVQDIPGEIDEDDQEDIKVKQAQYLKVCTARMRIGYRKAKARFEQYGRFFANDLFWSIEEAVKPWAKSPEYEGQVFKLEFGMDKQGNSYAYCSEYYEEEEGI